MLSVVMMFAFALGVVITRHRRDISMAPAICLSQIILIVAAGPFAEPGTIGRRICCSWSSSESGRWA